MAVVTPYMNMTGLKRWAARTFRRGGKLEVTRGRDSDLRLTDILERILDLRVLLLALAISDVIVLLLLIQRRKA